MFDARSADIADLENIRRLVDRVFLKDTPGESMFVKYPTLFSEENIEHVNVIKQDAVPVAAVNYYPSEIKIGEAVIEAASIGAVATHEEFRERGYGGTLVRYSLDKMEKEGIDIVLISGTKSIYIKNECYKAGKTFLCRATWEPLGMLDKESVCLVPYREELFRELYRLYNLEDVRYLRSYENFRIMFRAQSCKYRNTTVHTYLIQKDGIYSGYVMVSVPFEEMERKGAEVRLVEYAGCREDIVSSLKDILERYEASSVNFRIPSHERDFIAFIKSMNMSLEPQFINGTLKILNYPQFMNRLKGRFEKAGIGKISFFMENEIFVMNLDRCRFVFKNRQALNTFIFGNIQDCRYEDIFSEYESSFLYRLESIFPIPFVDTENINYI